MNNRLNLAKQRVAGSHMMRAGALEQLTDADLLFSPGGENITLGELLKESGELQHTYTQSLETHQHDWSYQNSDENLATNVNQLKSWFQQLNTEMEQTLDNLTDEDWERQIDRTDGVFRTTEQQIDIYTQATLIFLGKLVIYFKAMNRSLPKSIEHYIG